MVEYKFTKKEVNLTQLIVEAGIGNMGMKTKGDFIWFIFEEELSSADKTKLDNAVENHIAQPEEPTQNPVMEKLDTILTKLNNIDAKIP